MDLNTLIDKDRAIETVTRLFVATDNRDWETVKACFADDVEFDMTSLAGGEPTQMTPEAIVVGWDVGLAGLHSIHHQVGNFLATIDGDRADVFCYGITSHYLPEAPGGSSRTFVGSYDFALERAGDGWRVSLFRFNCKYLTGNAKLGQE